MTDELSIQQPKQGSYAVPGLIAGGVVGGAGGALAAHKGYGFASKPNLDEVFAQEADTFKRQIEKGGDNKGAWETAQTWANKVKDAETEFDKEVARITSENSVAKDPEIATKLAAAEADYAAALNEQKNILGKTSSGNISSFPTAEQVKNLGEKVSMDELTTYKGLLDAYNNNLKTATANADRTALNDFEHNVIDHIENISNISNKQRHGLFSARAHKKAIEKAVNALDSDIAKLIPEISDPARIQAAMKAAGHDYKPGSKNYTKFVNKLNEQVRAERAALKEQILGEKVAINVIDPKTKKVVGQRISYKNVEGYINSEGNTFNRSVKLERRILDSKIAGLTYDTLEPVNSYQKQLEKLQKNKNITIAQKEAQEKELKKLISLATEKENIKQAEQKRIDRFFSKIEYTNKLEGKIDKAIKQNGKVQSAYQKLRNFIEKHEAIKGITEETSLTADEITAKATEALKDKEVATKLKAFRKQAEEKGTELTEKGKKLIEELGTKENYSSKIKEQAKKEIEPILEKLKLPSKTWTGLAAGAVLALAGLGVGYAAKKDQA